MKKRLLLATPFLLALGAGVWWLSGGGRPRARLPDVPVLSGAEQAVEPGARLRAPAPGVADGVPSAVQQPAREAVVSEVAVEASPADEALVTVQVLRSDTRDAASHAVVLLLRAEEQQPVWIIARSRSAGLGDAASVDAQGRCTFRIPAGVRARAVLRATSSAETGAEEVIEALAPGEVREVTLVLQVFEHWIRVEDAGDGAALAGARVRGDGQTASSGPDGLAMLWFAKDGGGPAEVEAEGYGTALLHLGKGHEDPQSALVVRLSRTACLRGRLLDASGAPVAAARIDITAAGHDLARTEFFGMQEDGSLSVTGFEDRRWSASADDSGTFVVCALPALVPLRISSVVDHQLVVLFERLRLSPGEQREVACRVGALAVIRGSVHDESGQPVPGCELWLWPDLVGYFADDGLRPERSLSSDAEGSFQFAEVSPGDWSVGPAPGSGYLPVPMEVHVEGSDVTEVALEARVARLFVGGRVLGPDGEPAPKVEVQSDIGPVCVSGIDGGFALGPFAPGPVTLSVAAPEAGVLAPQSLQVEAGQQGVVLQFGRGGRLAGRLVDDATGQPTAGMVSLITEDWEMRMSSVGANGEFALEGLRPGTYGLAARAPGGAAGFLDHLDVPASGPGRSDLVIRMVPGGQLLLRFPHESDRREYRVRSGACIFLRDVVGPEESVTPHLPPGAVTVELLTPRGAVVLSSEASVHAGETVLVDLSKEP